MRRKLDLNYHVTLNLLPHYLAKRTWSALHSY